MPKGGTKERWSRPKGYLSRAELCDCSIICFFLCFFFWLLAGLIKVTWPGLHFEPLLCGHAWPRKMFSHQMQLFGQKEIQSLDACSRTFAQRRRHLRREVVLPYPLIPGNYQAPKSACRQSSRSPYQPPRDPIKAKFSQGKGKLNRGKLRTRIALDNKKAHKKAEKNGE